MQCNAASQSSNERPSKGDEIDPDDYGEFQGFPLAESTSQEELLRGVATTDRDEMERELAMLRRQVDAVPSAVAAR